MVGRSTPLTKTQAQTLPAAITPAGLEHPWPDVISSTRFGASRDKVPLVKVEPLIVAEVSADSALQGGGYRHPLRYLRPRFDLTPDDLAEREA